MENPFLFAIALFESRKITARLLASARENEPDFGVERDEPIDWRLLDEACDATGKSRERLQSRSASPTCCAEGLAKAEAKRAPKDVRKDPRTACPT
jgi:hypothetical protein